MVYVFSAKKLTDHRDPKDGNASPCALAAASLGGTGGACTETRTTASGPVVAAQHQTGNVSVKKYIRLRTYGGRPDTAYLELQDHPHEPTFGVVAKTIHLHEVIDNYNGPWLSLDFDAMNRPIGIEILYPTQDEDNNDGIEPSE